MIVLANSGGWNILFPQKDTILRYWLHAESLSQSRNEVQGDGRRQLAPLLVTLVQDKGYTIHNWFFQSIIFFSRIKKTIPLTISTTKRVNTCLVPSSDSWTIQAKKMDPCTSFCSKRVCTVSCSGVPFGSHKSETHFVVIYFGMRCVVPETL